MHRNLPDEMKKKLRDAFNNIHKQPNVKPEMIRGYGGKKVDRYNADYPEAEFDAAMAKLAAVTEALKGEILKKAGG
jgi:phosphonate transport system substrate-binding protein